MTDPTIGVATPGDAPVVARLVGAFRDHLGAGNPGDDDLVRYVPRSLADPSLEFCIAWLGAEAVGYTQSRFHDSLWALGVEAHLEDLFVLEALRGRSVGRALLRNALARARQRGARAFTLTTNERNESAQELYRSEGIAPQDHARWPGSREILWVKKLASGPSRPGPTARLE